MKIGILTGGGDCLGLNPAIKSIVENAYNKGYEVLGLRDGWKGLVKATEDYLMPLNKTNVRTIDRTGGTILGTSRTNPFKTNEPRDKDVIMNIKKLDLEGLIVMGGEDTLGVAAKLYKQYNVPVVGIPKTIDRDLSATDYTLGFDSAVGVIMEGIRNLRTTAGSHNITMLVETMGRRAGHLALVGGLVGGADIILIPEYDFDINKINDLLLKRREAGNRYSIIVVSEGAKPKNAEAVVVDESLDEFGHVKLGGIGNYLKEVIGEGTGIKTKCTILGYLQRGGAPSQRDTLMGHSFGVAAVDALSEEKYGKMVSLKGSKIVLVDLEDAVRDLQLVDVGKYYDTETYNVKKSSILGKSIYI